jgi:HEPN domain-containing protein
MATQDCLEWLKFARMDIDAAQSLFSKQQNPRHRPIEVILYHCQQGVEKALKAYIVQNGALTKNLQLHDIQVLRQACAQWSSRFGNSRVIGHCAYLDPFSIVVRYPNHNLTLDSSHAARGLNSSKRVFDFVCEQLGLMKVYFSR